MNKKHNIDEWLQMNFPVSAGPEIVIGDDLLPSPHHYMTIQFGSDIEGAHFIIMETPEDTNGLRSSQDMAVASFTMPKDLLLKIVRVIGANEDRFPLHNDPNLAEW
jgi:hypothetical protein